MKTQIYLASGTVFQSVGTERHPEDALHDAVRQVFGDAAEFNAEWPVEFDTQDGYAMTAMGRVTMRGKTIERNICVYVLEAS